MSSIKQDKIVRKMVEAVGHATQSLGVGRVLGQIFAWVYFSREPQSLDSITGALGISKGSASMGVRQLEQWGALEKVWVKGDRKDYYRANDLFGRIVKNVILDLAGKRIESSSALLDRVESELASKRNTGLTEDDLFVIEQIAKIRKFQEKARGMWDGVLLKMLLK